MTAQNNAQLDALHLTAAVRDRLVDFAVDDCFTRDPRLTEISRRLWCGDAGKGGLVSDLWVEGAFPPERANCSLASLAATGEFDRDLCRVLDASGAVPSDRPLYAHQRDSLLAAGERGPQGERPAVVVTAGTGAGKTECFLLPLLDALYRYPRSGPGMQCLILYPMNALINDQVDRLYGWLKDQSKVTLFHFTSETPERARDADHERVPKWNVCRMRSREEARGVEGHNGRATNGGPVPDIIITNYSMLEYMLCRPQDAVFFGSGLRTLVLDEAHLYVGTLAAEITLLLRRLFARCGVRSDDVLQIATSATLGTGESEELREFAAKIFSKDSARVSVIRGKMARVPLGDARAPAVPLTPECVDDVAWLDQPTLVADVRGELDLGDSAELCNRLRQRLGALTSTTAPAEESRPAVLLHTVLAHAPMVHQLEDILWQKRRLPLSSLAELLWKGRHDAKALRATIVLLQLAAAARGHVSAYPLVPHRIHLLVRPTEGLSVCLNPECTAPEDEHLQGLGAVIDGVMEALPTVCGCRGPTPLPMQQLRRVAAERSSYREPISSGGRR